MTCRLEVVGQTTGRCGVIEIDAGRTAHRNEFGIAVTEVIVGRHRRSDSFGYVMTPAAAVTTMTTATPIMSFAAVSAGWLDCGWCSDLTGWVRTVIPL